MVQEKDTLLWPVIEQDIIQSYNSMPRSMQKTIGPSELGTDSLHTLAAKLAGWESARHYDQWRAMVGTAVHKQLENVFIKNQEVSSHPVTGEPVPRFQPELKVNVGQLYDHNVVMSISGRIDLYDIQTQTIIDWKTCGLSSRRKALNHGIPQIYAVQASLYGIGLRASGLPVTTNCIYYMPVDKGGLKDVIPLRFPFNPQIGLWALHRAQKVLTMMNQIEDEDGVDMRDAWISQLPESPSYDFSDRTWKDDSGAQQFIGPDVPVSQKWIDVIPQLEGTYKM